MRKAFTFIELLVVVTILPVIMVAVSGVYATFIRDVPRATRLLQENTTVLNLLQQMRRDVDGATGLPEQFEGQRADEHTLLIEQPGGVICYQLDNGRVVRTLLGVTPSGSSSNALTGTLQTESPAQERLWRVPHAVIAWRLWEHDGRAYAVEIHSHVKQQIEGLWREKLANSYVFFIRSLAQEGEIP